MFGLGVSAVCTQLALMREGLAAFGGNEMVLGVVLGNWLLLTGLGAAGGRAAGRLRRPGGILVAALVLIAVLPIGQVFALRVLRDVVFIRGTAIGVAETVVASFVLLAPYCLVSGLLLTLGCAALSAAEGPGGIGRVYLADSLGSIAGGVLFSFILIHLFDHFGILYFPAFLNLLLAGLAAWLLARPMLPVVAAAAAGLLALALAADLDAAATARQYPGRPIVFRGHSPYGRLVVAHDAGQYNFIENGLTVLSTHNVQQVEETVHYAMSQRPGAASVLLIGGGVSGTAREILRCGARQVTYVELDPLIIEVGRRFLPDNLADGRIRVVNTDGRLFIRRTDQRYDVVIVDAPDPSTLQLNRFHTREFFGEAKRVLAPGGVLSFALGRYENYVSPQLALLLGSAQRTLAGVFANVLAVPGGRVFFLASDGPLDGDIAGRVEAAGVPTRLVNRHYLTAMLTPDRLADIRRATSTPAAVNEDLNPRLYYYHLRHWASQFQFRFGVLEAALLGLLAIYLATLRAVPQAVFVSGFAASALEVVLLLGVQILCGSLYVQVGVVVTAFMAGLAAGAFAAGRWRPQAGRPRLAGLQFAIAAYAAGLPWGLSALGRAGGSAGWLLAVQAIIAGLTFLLGVLEGLEFPLASRVEAESSPATLTASRLYAADFVGACLGALLASTLLLPLIGVAGVCLATAGLNVLAGAMVLLRRR